MPSSSGSSTLRVLHLVSSLDASEGVPVAVARMIAAQRLAGVTCRVAACVREDAQGSLLQELRDACVEVEIFSPALRRRPARGKELAKLQHLVAHADAVHAHGFFERLLHQGLLLPGPAVRILSPHGMLTGWSLGQKRWKKRAFFAMRGRRLLRELDVLHFCSRAEERESIQSGGASRRVVALPFEPPSLNGMSRSKRFASSPIVVFVGRIVAGKGVDVLIDAFARIKHPTAVLHLIGGFANPHGQACRASAARSGAGDRIVFTGRLGPAEVAQRLGAAALFVLPSEHENFGQAAVEAMAAGLPCLLASEVALREEPGVAAVSGSAPREAAALAAEMDQWLADPARCAEVGAAAARWVEQRLSPSSVGASWASLLQEVAGGRLDACLR